MGADLALAGDAWRSGVRGARVVLAFGCGGAVWLGAAADRSLARAGETPGTAYRTVVRAEGEGDGLDAQRGILRSSPGFATAVELGSEKVVRPGEDLADVLTQVPGAKVRSLGGLGQFSSVSLRGSSGQQVRIFLDGVPIDGSMAGLTDLSEQPLDGLERVEVYRGYIPVAFGGATIGGAIHLVGRAPTKVAKVRVDAGLGSFGARQARAFVWGPVGRRHVVGVDAGYAAAEGNYWFYDDAKTPTNFADDGRTRRTNNGYERVTTRLRVDGRYGRLRLAQTMLVGVRRGGVPGPASAQSTTASQGAYSVRSITALRAHGVGGAGNRVEWVMGLGAMGRRFRDPDGQVGIDRDDERNLALDGLVSPRLRLGLWRGAFLGLVSDARLEWIDVDNRKPRTDTPSLSTGDATRSRHSLGAGAELEQFLWRDRIELVPAVRVDLAGSRFRVPMGEGEVSDAGRDSTQIGFSPRLGVRARILEGVELRSSAGRYFRVPTLAELFGDRGYIVGNEGLVPERGTTIDGGITLERAFAKQWRVLGHGAGFATWSEDLITFVVSGPVVRPENLRGARIRGLESALGLRWRRDAIALDVNYTLLDTSNLSLEAEQHGRPLPGRPRHDLFTRIGGGYAFRTRRTFVEPHAFYSLEAVSGTFLDPSGRVELPARLLHGVGAVLRIARVVRIGAEARNLLDRAVATLDPEVGPVGARRVPVADFLGYPLPGRSLWMFVRIDLSPERAPKARLAARGGRRP